MTADRIADLDRRISAAATRHGISATDLDAAARDIRKAWADATRAAQLQRLAAAIDLFHMQIADSNRTLTRALADYDRRRAERDVERMMR